MKIHFDRRQYLEINAKNREIGRALNTCNYTMEDLIRLMPDVGINTGVLIERIWWQKNHETDLP